MIRIVATVNVVSAANNDWITLIVRTRFPDGTENVKMTRSMYYEILEDWQNLAICSMLDGTMVQGTKISAYTLAATGVTDQFLRPVRIVVSQIQEVDQ